jgi:hypothetical protein
MLIWIDVVLDGCNMNGCCNMDVEIWMAGCIDGCIDVCIDGCNTVDTVKYGTAEIWYRCGALKYGRAECDGIGKYGIGKYGIGKQGRGKQTDMIGTTGNTVRWEEYGRNGRN